MVAEFLTVSHRCVCQTRNHGDVHTLLTTLKKPDTHQMGSAVLFNPVMSGNGLIIRIKRRNSGLCGTTGSVKKKSSQSEISAVNHVTCPCRKRLVSEGKAFIGVMCLEMLWICLHL